MVCGIVRSWNSGVFYPDWDHSASHPASVKDHSTLFKPGCRRCSFTFCCKARRTSQIIQSKRFRSTEYLPSSGAAPRQKKDSHSPFGALGPRRQNSQAVAWQLSAYQCLLPPLVSAADITAMSRSPAPPAYYREALSARYHEAHAPDGETGTSELLFICLELLALMKSWK